MSSRPWASVRSLLQGSPIGSWKAKRGCGFPPEKDGGRAAVAWSDLSVVEFQLE